MRPAPPRSGCAYCGCRVGCAGRKPVATYAPAGFVHRWPGSAAGDSVAERRSGHVSPAGRLVGSSLRSRDPRPGTGAALTRARQVPAMGEDHATTADPSVAVSCSPRSRGVRHRGRDETNPPGQRGVAPRARPCARRGCLASPWHQVTTSRSHIAPASHRLRPPWPGLRSPWPGLRSPGPCMCSPGSPREAARRIAAADPRVRGAQHHPRGTPGGGRHHGSRAGPAGRLVPRPGGNGAAPGPVPAVHVHAGVPRARGRRGARVPGSAHGGGARGRLGRPRGRDSGGKRHRVGGPEPV